MLATLPASFVDAPGAVRSPRRAPSRRTWPASARARADLQGYYQRHRPRVRHGVLQRGGVHQPGGGQAGAGGHRLRRRPSPRWPATATQSGTIPCTELVAVAGELERGSSRRCRASPSARRPRPISVNGNYLVLELTKRTPTSYATAKPIVAQAVPGGGRAGDPGRPITRRGAPRHGEGRPALRHVAAQSGEDRHAVHPADVRRAQRAGQRGRRSRSRAARSAAEPWRDRPHIVVVGLGPAGGDLIGVGTARAPAHSARGAGCARPATRRPALFEGAHASTTSTRRPARSTRSTRPSSNELVAAAEAAAPETVVYAVPGSPLVAERTVELLRARRRVEVTIVPALSFLDLAWSALGDRPARRRGPARRRDGVRGDGRRRARAVPGGPVLVAPSCSRRSSWRSPTIARMASPRPGAAAPPRPRTTRWWSTVDWWELDRTIEPDHLTSLYVPRVGGPGGHRRRRRGGAPGRAGGHAARSECPWDRAQDPRVAHAAPARGVATRCSTPSPHWSPRPDSDVGLRRTSKRSWATSCSRSSSTPGWPARSGHFTWPTWPGACTTSWSTGIPTSSATWRRDDAEPGRGELGGDQEEREGRASVTEGIPTALPALMFTTKLPRKARAVGVEPYGLRDATAAMAGLTSLAQLAEHATPHADDPLARDARDVERQVGEVLFAVVEPRAASRRRPGTGAAGPRAASCARTSRRAEGVPDTPEGTH